MISSLKFLPNPFRFLLITEWVMLGSCGSLAVVEAWQGHMIPVQHISILVILGAMGLVLPTGKLIVKVIFTAIEIGLIFYGTVLGYLHILPTLYLIVVMRSCFLFESLGRWVATGVVFILFLSDQYKHIQRALPNTSEEQIQFAMHLVAETLIFGLSVFFVLQLTNRVLSERMMRQQLANAHEQLQQYAQKVDNSLLMERMMVQQLANAHEQLQQYAQKVEELATVQERNRIARDIHDSLGHALTSLNIQMQTAVKLWEKQPNQARSFLGQAQELGKTAMKEVRKSISTLREDKESEQPLKVRIETLVDDYCRGTGLSVSTEISPNISRYGSISQPVATTIYRIVQESLTNIFKYAQATQVRIKLSRSHEQIYLTVTDDGKGFDPNQNQAGFGLRGMQERIAAVKGQLQLQTSPGQGCKIKVEIPLVNK
ncbi:MAG: sensor histidine kinase [Waterburya sp.]